MKGTFTAYWANGRLVATLFGAVVSVMACSDRIQRQPGDLSDEGGSPTVRRPFEPSEDDPFTSNDESNDPEGGDEVPIRVPPPSLPRKMR